MDNLDSIKELKELIKNGSAEVPFKNDDIGIQLLELAHVDTKLITLLKSVNKKYLLLYAFIAFVVFFNSGSELNTIDAKYEKNSIGAVQELNIPCLENIIVIDDMGISREYEVLNRRNSLLTVLNTVGVSHNIQIKLMSECKHDE